MSRRARCPHRAADDARGPLSTSTARRGTAEYIPQSRSQARATATLDARGPFRRRGDLRVKSRHAADEAKECHLERRRSHDSAGEGLAPPAVLRRRSAHLRRGASRSARRIRARSAEHCSAKSAWDAGVRSRRPMVGATGNPRRSETDNPSVIRLAGDRRTTPSALRYPEKCSRIRLLHFSDRCGNCGFASSATGSAKPHLPLHRGAWIASAFRQGL